MTFIYKARYRRPIHPKASGGFWIKEQAQSLLEVAVFITFFIPLVCYAIDLGYFYIVAAALSSSARNAAEYSIQGNGATASSKLPDGASVAALATGDISSFPSVSTSIYVCSLVTASHPLNCQSYGTNTVSYTVHNDPELTMQLNHVDVVYTISPPIPLGFAGTSLSMIPTSFRRTVEMRAIN